MPSSSALKSFATIAALVAVACGHTTSSVPPALQRALSNPEAPSLNVSSLGIQLTQQGDNDSPFISPDGKKVVYVSRRRAAHTHGQIYVYDLDTLKERRVTYQDGECRDPIFLKDSKRIVYASTTDELKESPLIVRSKEEKLPYPLTDLYVSDLSGSDIERLTNQDGFDGFPWPRWDRPQSITFSRYTDSQLSSYQLNLESKHSVLLLRKKDFSIESLQLSPDKKQWAWIERAKTGTTQVWTGPFLLQSNKQTALSLPNGEYKEVQWLAPQKLFITAKIFKKYFQFYSFDLETKCLQSLFDSNTDLASPRLQVERQGLVFSSSQDGRSDIFYKSIPALLPGTCLSLDQKPN